MSDYQKYIDALRKCAKEHEYDRTSTGHIVVSNLCRDTADLLEELSNSENPNKWIPVSERLPKAFETVLRTRVENGWNGTTYTIVDIGCICPADHNIVAWMPLPEPYKAESEEV